MTVFSSGGNRHRSSAPGKRRLPRRGPFLPRPPGTRRTPPRRQPHPPRRGRPTVCRPRRRTRSSPCALNRGPRAKRQGRGTQDRTISPCVVPASSPPHRGGEKCATGRRRRGTAIRRRETLFPGPWGSSGRVPPFPLPCGTGTRVLPPASPRASPPPPPGGMRGPDCPKPSNGTGRKGNQRSQDHLQGLGDFPTDAAADFLKRHPAVGLRVLEVGTGEVGCRIGNP